MPHEEPAAAPFLSGQMPRGSADRTSRRQMLSGLLAGAATVLAGCAPTTEPPPAAVIGGEPFPVRRVNRDRFDAAYRPATVANATGEAPGTIVVDTRAKHLYLVTKRDEALRYGIAVGAAGYAWSGAAIVGRKAAWPAWYPTDDMRAVSPDIPRRIPPGADNPLGARALYLYQNGRDTLYRIHGTSEPWTIGTQASSGCIRMFNEDVMALYDKVGVGTKVVVR